MPRRTAITFSLACIAIHAACASPLPRDKDLEQLLDGAWCSSDDGGKTCWGIDDMAAGTSTTCVQAEQKFFSAKSKYVVRGNVVCHEVTESSDTGVMAPGEKICLEVIGIDKQTQSYRYANAKEIHTIYRIDRAKAKCPAAPA